MSKQIKANIKNISYTARTAIITIINLILSYELAGLDIHWNIITSSSLLIVISVTVVDEMSAIAINRNNKTTKICSNISYGCFVSIILLVAINYIFALI